jgi:hypothetical protein
MNDLTSLESLIGNLPTAEALTEARYARLPFYLLANHQPPFDAWRRPETRIPDGLEPLWQQAAAGCQLCAFHASNAVTIGSAFAERILEAQKQFLNQLREGLGDQHQADIRKLYEFAQHPLQIQSKDGDLLEIPSDWRIAVDFLLTSPASPYRNEDAVFSIEGAPCFPGEVDVALALDLEHAWALAAEHFTGLAQTLA